MRAYISILLILAFSFISYSQEIKNKETEDGKVQIEDLPEVVVKRANDDFSVYLADSHPDKKVRAVQEKFVAYDLGKDYMGFEQYLLLMKTKKGSLVATYDENGTLVSVVENYKNVRVPNEVVYSIVKTFPGWALINDKYLYSQEKGDVLNKLYNIKIKKGNQSKLVKVTADGTIIKVK